MYQPGTRYEYEYSLDVSNLFVGTSNNASTMHIESKIHLDFLTKCEGVLTFTEVTLFEKYKSEDDNDEFAFREQSKISSDFEEDIKKNPIR